MSPHLCFTFIAAAPRQARWPLCPPLDCGPRGCSRYVCHHTPHLQPSLPACNQNPGKTGRAEGRGLVSAGLCPVACCPLQRPWGVRAVALGAKLLGPSGKGCCRVIVTHFVDRLSSCWFKTRTPGCSLLCACVLQQWAGWCLFMCCRGVVVSQPAMSCRGPPACGSPRNAPRK
jgi:hypothetical protein